MEVIFHKTEIIGRSKGYSAVKAAAYRSASILHNEYNGLTHYYDRKRGVSYTDVMLPENAPREFSDREYLWNAVEKVEKSSNAQLAREVKFALPIELDRQRQIEAVKAHVQEQFVSQGMCADIAIHMSHGHNPHAHVMLTMRSLDENGQWLKKQEKVYILDKEGNKQYDPVKRSYKHKTRKINDWDDKDNARRWHEEWAKVCNRELEKIGRERRFTNLSYKDQGLDIIPTIHLGKKAHQLEKQGIETELGNKNRAIRVFNSKYEQDLKNLEEKQKLLVKLQDTAEREKEVREMENGKTNNQSAPSQPISQSITPSTPKAPDRSAGQTAAVKDVPSAPIRNIKAPTQEKKPEMSSAPKQPVRPSGGERSNQSEKAITPEISKQATKAPQKQSEKAPRKLSQVKQPLKLYDRQMTAKNQPRQEINRGAQERDRLREEVLQGKEPVEIKRAYERGIARAREREQQQSIPAQNKVNETADRSSQRLAEQSHQKNLRLAGKEKKTNFSQLLKPTAPIPVKDKGLSNETVKSIKPNLQREVERQSPQKASAERVEIYDANKDAQKPILDDKKQREGVSQGKEQKPQITAKNPQEVAREQKQRIMPKQTEQPARETSPHKESGEVKKQAHEIKPDKEVVEEEKAHNLAPRPVDTPKKETAREVDNAQKIETPVRPIEKEQTQSREVSQPDKQREQPKEVKQKQAEIEKPPKVKESIYSQQPPEKSEVKQRTQETAPREVRPEPQQKTAHQQPPKEQTAPKAQPERQPATQKPPERPKQEQKEQAQTAPAKAQAETKNAEQAKERVKSLSDKYVQLGAQISRQQEQQAKLNQEIFYKEGQSKDIVGRLHNINDYANRLKQAQSGHEPQKTQQLNRSLQQAVTALERDHGVGLRQAQGKARNLAAKAEQLRGQLNSQPQISDLKRQQKEVGKQFENDLASLTGVIGDTKNFINEIFGVPNLRSPDQVMTNENIAIKRAQRELYDMAIPKEKSKERDRGMEFGW